LAKDLQWGKKDRRILGVTTRAATHRSKKCQERQRERVVFDGESQGVKKAITTPGTKSLESLYGRKVRKKKKVEKRGQMIITSEISKTF